MPDNDKKSIFLSWSGEESKKIAKKLKEELLYFFDNRIDVFFSAADIPSGTEWFAKIKTELQKCQVGILCITKENFDSPWINFESGAMIACNIDVIPVLFGASRLSYKSPMDSINNITFEKEEFCKFMQNLNKELGAIIPQDTIEKKARQLFSSLKGKIANSLKILHDKRVFSAKYVYPQDINHVNKDTLYLSTPMASIDEPTYNEQRNFLLELHNLLLSIGFKNIVCPAISINNQSNFDGSTKANFDNYRELKQADSFIGVYPKPLPSSVLIEIGYAIALSKRIVIFCRGKEDLPFMLREADSTISNLKIYEYQSYEDILNTVRANKMALFVVGGGDDK